MRNRAKCRLCNDTIESKEQNDYVRCSCDQIAVDGGNAYWRCSAKDWANFIRLDDEGNEIIPKIVEKENPDELLGNSEELNVINSNNETVENYQEVRKPNKEDLLRQLDIMIERYETLPDMAMSMPITHYDHASLLVLLSALFQVDNASNFSSEAQSIAP